MLRKEFKIFKIFFSKILSLLSLPKKFISNKKKIFLTNIQNIKKKRDRLYKLKTKKKYFKLKTTTILNAHLLNRKNIIKKKT